VVFESLPANIQADEVTELSEYDKRMKRAARFGLDPAKVAGPQAAAASEDQEMADFSQVRGKMELIQGGERVEKI
jgi:hypothetical protein